MAERRTFARRGSVRLRTTLAATLAVAVALTVGAVVMVTVLRASLESNRRAAATSRAQDIAALAASGRLPATLGLPGQDATFAQVVGAGGTVVAASTNIAGEPPVGPPLHGRRSGRLTIQGNAIGQNGRYGLVAVPAREAARALTVYAGYSLALTDLAVGDVELALAVGLPLLVVLVACTSWWIVGRAMRPIDLIRAEVARITTEDLHRRVPVPATDDELGRLALTMNGMLDRIEAGADRQRAFVADASHELRSPLTALRTQLEVGLAAGPSTDWPATAEGALAEEQRLERLVTDLLLLARLEAHPDQRRPHAGQRGAPGSGVCDLAATAEADLAHRPSPPALRLRTGGDRRPLVRVDEHLARRVVSNLVDNACRHARSAVSVSVEVCEGATVELVVADDGPGVAPEDRERVFERFTRLDAARGTDSGGAGLGLAIVRDIVVRHGGSVRFTDAPLGARVVVRLPAAPAPDAIGAPVAGTPASRSYR